MTDHIEAVAKALSIALAERGQSTEELSAIAIQAYQQAVASESAPAPIPAGWMPIETAPKDGTQILLNQDDLVVLGFRAEDKWHFFDGVLKSDEYEQGVGLLNFWVRDDVGPTHWMPLPAAPTPEAENE